MRTSVLELSLVFVLEECQSSFPSNQIQIDWSLMTESIFLANKCARTGSLKHFPLSIQNIPFLFVSFCLSDSLNIVNVN